MPFDAAFGMRTSKVKFMNIGRSLFVTQRPQEKNQPVKPGCSMRIFYRRVTCLTPEEIMGRQLKNQMLMQAQKFTEALAKDARADLADRLYLIDKACNSLLEVGGVVTVKSVRSWLATNSGLAISAASFSNSNIDATTGERTYRPQRRIVEKYAEIQRIIEDSSGRNSGQPNVSHPPSTSVAFLSDDELGAINDNQVRYKVQLLQGRVKNLLIQNNNFRKISNLPLLSASMFGEQFKPAESQCTANPIGKLSGILVENELSVLIDFLENGSLKSRQLHFDDVGTLRVTLPAISRRKEVRISKPGLEEVLKKLIRAISG
ncbi:hypothetical protein [Ruegeria denitrificans]|uniref:hypothetical protein n=1 Tax=Ruegeria denitrificans TaxID=1715692 RepID=UPI003C7B5E1B